MTFLAATILVPALLVLLAAGAGFLAERAAGRRLPGALVVPLGLGLLAALAALGTARPSLAPAGPWIAFAVGVAGWLVGGEPREGRAGRFLRPVRPWDRTIDRWIVGSALATYAFTLAPVLLAGRVTLTGYLLDGTVGIHLLGADQLLKTGRDFTGLPGSSATYALNSYFGAGYPAGAHALLGSLGRWTGLDPAWSYQPLLSVFLAVSALSLGELLRRFGVSRRAACAFAVVAVAPALVYAYTLMGAIKEIGLLPFLLLLTVLAFDYRDHAATAGARAAVPLGIAVGACVAVVGLSAGGWVGLVVLTCTLIAVHELRMRRLAFRSFALQALVLVGIVLLLALPTFTGLTQSVTLASSLSQTNVTLAADPGNLLNPLRFVQILGAWFGPDHRIDPNPHLVETYMLLGVVAIAFAFGVAYLLRTRRWLAFALVAAWGIALWVLTRRGTTWLDAKLLVLTSPMVIAVALTGADALRQGGRRVETWILAAVVAYGVGQSAVELYRATNLAPTERFQELQQVGERFAGQGPTFSGDFDEVALYFERHLDPEGPGYAHRTGRTAQLSGGRAPAYGSSYDHDQLDWGSLREFNLIVQRRSPLWSRPPSSFESVFRGEYYEVFRRTKRAGATAEHVGVGGDFRSGTPDCAALEEMVGRARDQDLRLVAGLSRPSLRLDPMQASKLPTAWTPHAQGGVVTSGVGILVQRFDLTAAGRYRIWLQGDFGRSLDIAVDGRRIGETGRVSGGDRNMAGGMEVELEWGAHELTLTRGRGGIRPGAQTPSRLVTSYVEPVAGTTQQVWPLSRWRRLCRRSDVDWLELRNP